MNKKLFTTLLTILTAATLFSCGTSNPITSIQSDSNSIKETEGSIKTNVLTLDFKGLTYGGLVVIPHNVTSKNNIVTYEHNGIHQFIIYENVEFVVPTTYFNVSDDKNPLAFCSMSNFIILDSSVNGFSLNYKSILVPTDSSAKFNIAATFSGDGWVTTECRSSYIYNTIITKNSFVDLVGYTFSYTSNNVKTTWYKSGTFGTSDIWSVE